MKMLSTVALFLFMSCAFAEKHPPLQTVEKVELQKYLGKWYEIARFDQFFQRGCTATTATYSLRKDGDIRVLNECRLEHPDGELKSAVGRAWIKDKDTNARLKVQFFLRGIKLWFLSGKYWILELGENYEYALIGEPSRKYLWILSRTPEMDSQTYDMLVEKAKEKGFDVSKLIKTEH